MSNQQHPPKPNRRHILQGAALAVASTWAAGTAHAQVTGKAAVIFLSRSGNTRMLGGALSRRFNTDLVEIRPRTPWPEEYEQMVAWASRWRESGRLLPLQAMPDLSGHSTVFLGFPIWGMALPAPIHSFLSQTGLAGKTVLPFITHGGFGTGSAMATLRDLAPDARLAPEFVLQCDQERDNLNALQGWLSEIGGSIPG